MTSAKSVMLYKLGKKIFPALILAVAYLSFTGCVLSSSSGINGSSTQVVVIPQFDAISPGTYDNSVAETLGVYVYRDQETFTATGVYEAVDYETSIADIVPVITSYTKITGTWKQNDSLITLTASQYAYRTTFIGEDNVDSTISPPDTSPAFHLKGKVTDSSFAVVDSDGQTVNLKKATKVVLSF